MKRGEVWWAFLENPAGHRPVLLLSRNESYSVRDMVTVAPVYSRIRQIRAEVVLDPADGMPRPCAVNLDSLQTIQKRKLHKRIAALTDAKMSEVDAAICFALAIRPPENRSVTEVPVD